MAFNSPLRYPGGKNKLAKFIASVCAENDITDHYVEPYAGGASVALHLLLNGYVRRVTINDLDRSLYAFWHSVLYNTDRFCSLIESVDVDVKTWKMQKSVQRDKNADLFALGFSTFFINRTNRSGILNGGIIGGVNQHGKYKINCRFNKKNLIERIKRIAEYKNRIHPKCVDARELVSKIQKQRCKNTLFYFDPPYYKKGPSLYMNYYTNNDHEDMASAIKKIKDAKWIVSYDNAPEIKKMYKGYRLETRPIVYTARDVRHDKEVLFFGDDTKIPRTTRGNPRGKQAGNV